MHWYHVPGYMVYTVYFIAIMFQLMKKNDTVYVYTDLQEFHVKMWHWKALMWSSV